MIAAHQFIEKARLTKRDCLLTAGGVPQAPHNLLNGPGNSLSAVRFVGEPFHFLFHPQVNEGCLPQEDDMRDSLRLFRFFFFSEAEVILTMKNHVIKRENFRTCTVPPWVLLAVQRPDPVQVYGHFPTGTQLLKAFPRLLLLFV